MTCAVCPADVPETRVRRGAKYCSPQCQLLACQRRFRGQAIEGPRVKPWRRTRPKLKS